MLPQLRELETRYVDRLVVIGVHSAKYPAEEESQHLAAAVQRLEIEHPVINDRGRRIWDAYSVRAWPSVMLVDPEGKVVAKHEGEFTVEMFEPFLESGFAEWEQAGLLDRTPLTGITQPAAPTTPLAFPGKVVAAGERLVIADTNHNRIVVTTLTGDVRQVIGSGMAGFADGSGDSSMFNHPQGLAVDSDTVYVADTDNHAIRQVDLMTGAVSTIAGTGEQALRYTSGGPALRTSLNSPWDVVLLDGVLWIAMAGFHQLWMHRPGGPEVRRFAGTGHEGLLDGSTSSGWLAQPSGLAAYGTQALVFTDSETSSVRTADLPGYGDGQVRTLIGKDLFDYGDIDGGPEVARLQHPLGVAWHAPSGTVYVADTYNNKIKRLDPSTGRIVAWLGDGQAGHEDGDGTSARFFESAGLSVTGDALWIADTNN
ncbi:MAG TPA: alkyl hydroperoxide reductase, partial [Thermomicrobiales bacterium]|nr:alkyl hydroperoxide reductase [Thermomicrobiales bacterium]